jgi:hypothetical protein
MFKIIYLPLAENVVSYQGESGWKPELFSCYLDAKSCLENNNFYINVWQSNNMEILPPFKETKNCPPTALFEKECNKLQKHLLEVVEVPDV